MKAVLVSTGLLVTILALPLAAEAHDRHDGRFFGVHDRYAQHHCRDDRHGHHRRHGHGYDQRGHHAWKHHYGSRTPWYAYQAPRDHRDHGRRGDHRRHD